MVSEFELTDETKQNEGVLILVLVEDGLGVLIDSPQLAVEFVLILVLVEDGLGDREYIVH